MRRILVREGGKIQGRREDLQELQALSTPNILRDNIIKLLKEKCKYLK